jgi:hypothetical protein
MAKKRVVHVKRGTSGGWKVSNVGSAERKGQISSKSLLAAAKRAVEQRDVHVVPSEGGWTVRREGATRATKRFDTQADALKWARRSAAKEQTDLVVHGRDGKIRSKDSFGNDPMPPKDKKK